MTFVIFGLFSYSLTSFDIILLSIEVLVLGLIEA